MANDKDFILKNAIEVGGSTKVTIGDAPASGSYAVGYTDASLWAYSSKSFSVTSQETDPAGFAFKSDGTKMYLIGRTNDTVYQYSLSTAWDVSTSSYDSVSFLASSQATNPACLIFKPDGTKMYILDYGNDDLFQYSLSTAWDVSTASYDSVLFDPSAQETTPRDFRFNADGTKIFLIGSTSDTVHQYSLSTAYDVGTASYDSVSFSVTGQTTFPGGIDFNADASKMYIFNYYDGIMLQYSLPSAYDIANATYDSVSFTITQDISFSRFRFSNDGTSLYVAGTGNDTVYQYSTGSTLATATFDTSTGNYFTHTPSADAQYGFSNAGAVQTFQLEVTGNQSVVGYDLSEAAYDSVSINLANLVTGFFGPYSFYMKPDGTKMYVTNSDASYGVEEFELSTAFDLSTTTHSGSFSVSGIDTNLRGITFKPDGTKMYLTGRSNDRVYEYALSTAWDATSASYTDFLSISSKHTNPTALMFNNDGTKLYTVGSSSLYINEWTLSTAYDVSSATYTQQFQIQGSSPTGISFNADGTTMFIVTSGNDIVYEYSLSTAYDVSTMVHQSTQDFTVAAQATFPVGVQFNSAGTKMYICDASTTTVYQYTTAVSTPITITWDADIQWAGGTAPDSPAANEKDLYTITTDDGGTTYVGVQSGDNFS